MSLRNDVEAGSPRWLRVWDPRADAARDAPCDADGFLLEPETLAWTTRGANLSDISAFEDARLIALIGEAGMGKSFAIREETDRLRASGRAAEIVRLAAFGPRGLSFDRLFDGGPFARWRAGSDALTLFLDGFDECGFAPERAAELIVEALRREDLSRLFVRIATRSLAWSERVRDTLQTLYGDVRELRLLPLRRAQAREALQRAGIASPEVEQRLGPLLAAPLTLSLVCDAARDGLDLASRSLTEVYERALRHRMDQAAAKDRRAATRTSTVARWMEAADFLGAASVLGGVGVFSLAATLQDARLDVSAALRDFPSLRDATSSVLEHGPFSGPESARSWQHANFAEFFAARWIAAHASSVEECLRWLAGEDGGLDLTALPAPVQGALGWLASSDKALFDHLCDRAPLLLLDVDPVMIDVRRRERLLRALLESDDLRATGLWSTYRRLRTIAGSDLSEVLISVFNDRSRALSGRVFALEIVAAQPTPAAIDAALAIALDETEPVELRVAAIGVVAQASMTQRRSLMCLLERGDQTLREHVLHALWRASNGREPAVSTAELLSIMSTGDESTWLRQSNFITHNFLANVPDEHVPSVALWVASLIPARVIEKSTLREMTGQIAHRCSMIGVRHDVLTAFSTLSEACLRVYLALPLLPDDLPLRIALAEDLVARGVLEEDIWHLTLILFSTDSDGRIDIAQVLERIYSASNHAAAEHAASVTFGLFRFFVEGGFATADQNNQAIQAMERIRARSTSLAKLSDWYFRDGLSLDDPDVVELRTAAIERLRVERGIVRSRDQIESHVMVALRAAADDPAGQFWRFVYWALARPQADGYTHHEGRTLIDCDYWRDAPSEARREIAVLAARYLSSATPDLDEWVANRRADYRIDAGFSAALVLAFCDALAEVGGTTWARWAPALLRDTVVNSEGYKLLPRVLDEASRRAPNALRTAVVREVDRQIDRRSHMWFMSNLPKSHDIILAKQLLQRVDVRATPAALNHLLCYIADTLPDESVARAKDLLDACGQMDSPHGYPLVLLGFLVRVHPDLGWSCLVRWVEKRDRFADEFARDFATWSNADRLRAFKMKFELLVETWTWSQTRWPYHVANRNDSSRRSGTRLRDAALRALTDAASAPDAPDESRAALDDLVARHPELPWLADLARRTARERAIARWRPWPVEVLLHRA